MTNPKSYIIWGCAGHARVLSSLISLTGGNVIAFFDNNTDVSSILPNVPLYIGNSGFTAWARDTEKIQNLYGLVAIGGERGRERLAIQKTLQAYGLKTSTIIHPSASVCPTAVLNSGTQVFAQAVIAAQTQVGSACIFNHHSTVDHECVIGNGVHVAPGATLCGCVGVGDFTMIGAGAVVLPRINIGTNVVIGAGSVVTRNIPSGAVVAGNPAKKLINRS